MSRKNFKSVPRNGNGRKSRFGHRSKKDLTGDQIVEIMRSQASELNDLEFHVFTRINAVYIEQHNFTLSDFQMASITGVCPEDIKCTIEHLIELKYFKIVPSSKNYSYLRYLELDSSTYSFYDRLFEYRKTHQESFR